MIPIEVDASVSGAVVGLGGLLGALLYVRRQLSKDATVIATEKAERDQIERLEQEISRLTAATIDAHASTKRAQAETERIRAQRVGDAQRLAASDANAAHLARERDQLLRDIRRAVRRLPQDVVDELETDFAMLGDVEERVEPKR